MQVCSIYFIIIHLGWNCWSTNCIRVLYGTYTLNSKVYVRDYVFKEMHLLTPLLPPPHTHTLWLYYSRTTATHYTHVTYLGQRLVKIMSTMYSGSKSNLCIKCIKTAAHSHSSMNARVHSCRYSLETRLMFILEVGGTVAYYYVCHYIDKEKWASTADMTFCKDPLS